MEAFAFPNPFSASAKARSREQRGVELEGRVLGRGAHQDDVAALDVGQEGVLLGAVEAVDLVDEEQGAPAGRGAQPLGVGHDALDLGDPRDHRREGHELGARRGGDQARERRLAGPRRAPEDQGRHPVRFDHPAQEAVRPDDRPLADDLVEGPGPQPLGERRVGRRRRRDLRPRSAGRSTVGLVEQRARHALILAPRSAGVRRTGRRGRRPR
jgi:hypothetical protein